MTPRVIILRVLFNGRLNYATSQRYQNEKVGCQALQDYSDGQGFAQSSRQQFDGSEAREIVTQAGTPKEKRFTGQSYLLTYGLPHFFFHVTTAYAILRHNGVEIGKKDFVGLL